jgi:tRNA_anti-like
MAIIACKECTREVSDQAERCPHCGVSIAQPIRRPPRRVKPWLYGVLTVVLLAWAALTTLWLTGIIPEPKQLAGFIGAGSGHFRTFKASAKTAGQAPPVGGAQDMLDFRAVNSAVYATSLEQLYQDYDANEVAIQSKIGGKPIRVSGAVAEISEDISGHPIVTLYSGSNSRADMVLSDDQRPAAAQLTKEDSVEIQCNKLQRIETRLHGSGCALVLVESGANPVYLAVSMSSKAGNPPLYIVGPMSRKTCLASSDTIAAQVNSNPKNDRVLSKTCAATARERVSLEDCHLSSTMSAIPDLPAAHLWKYDCMAPATETRKTARTAASRGTLIHAPAREAPEATEAPAEMDILPAPAAAVTEEIAVLPTPVPAPATASAPAPAPAPAPALSEAVAQAPKPDISPGSAGGAASAAVNPGQAGGSQQPTTAAVSSSTATAPTPPAAVADDLVPVRTKDPEAADRIVSYCSKITSGATNPTTVAARCRQDEMDAWTRLVIQNEFPTLDETSRRKCTEPPFPDSFVARESCAKYQLRVD